MTTYAGRPVFPAYFVDPAGNPQEGVLVTVYNRGTVVKPTVYLDPEKSEEVDNPFLTDAYGNAFPYLDPGEYDAVANGLTLPFSVLPDQAEVALLGEVTFDRDTFAVAWSNNGSAPTLHYTDGPDFSGPYLAGLGLSYADHNGWKISVGNNGIGLGISTELPSEAYPDGAGEDALALLISHFGPGIGALLRKSGDDTGTLLKLLAEDGGTGDLLEWESAAGEMSGSIDDQGAQWWTFETDPTLQSHARMAGNSAGMTLRMYTRTGDPDLAFPSAIFTSADTLNLGVADSPAAIGDETDRVIISMKAGNLLAFHGAEECPQAAHPVTLGDVITILTDKGLCAA